MSAVPVSVNAGKRERTRWNQDPTPIEMAEAAATLKKQIFSYPRQEIEIALGPGWLENAARQLMEIEESIRFNGIDFFIAQHHQVNFFKSECHTRLVMGGNQSGKTVCGVVEAINFWRNEHKYKPDFKRYGRQVVVIASETTKTMRMYIRPYLEKYIPKHEIAHVSYIRSGIIDYIEHINGNMLYLMSYDQGRKRFQGFQADAIHLDEEPPEDIYNEIKMRLVAKNGYLWLTLTPLQGLTWVFYRLYENDSENADEVDTYQWSIWENVTMSEDAIRRTLKDFPEEQMEARAFGNFIGLSGLVYPWLTRNEAYCKPFEVPSGWMNYIVLDPSGSGTTGALWVSVDPWHNQWTIKEYKDSGCTISQHAQRIAVINQGAEIEMMLMDSQAWALNPEELISTFQMYQQSFNKLGLRFPIAKARKDVLPGVQKVWEYHNAAKFYVKRRSNPEIAPDGLDHPYSRYFNNLYEFKKEARRYRFPDGDVARTTRTSQNPIKKNDHLMDCDRYGKQFPLMWSNKELAKVKKIVRRTRRYRDPVTNY